jgi:hypothetical protein
MADTPAERMRRSRKHARGDHAACDPRRCEAARAAPPPRDTEAQEPDPGSVADAVAVLAESARFADADPRAVLVKLAFRLACAADDNPADVPVTRELRAILQFIADHPGTPLDQIDELQIRRRARMAVSALERAEASR